jgi:hypothetical protein
MRHLERSHPAARILFAAAAVLAVPFVAGAQPPWDYVVSVNSDYDVSGRVSVIDVLPPWSVDDPVASVHSDADARYYDGLVYVVNHLYADNIQVLDPANGFSTVRQFSVGPGSNPQDLAFVSASRAYVSRYESAILYEVNPATGAVTDSLDLSAFADADGIPEMSGMAIHGGLLFVAVQRLDRDYYWIPVPPSYLAVIDVASNEIVDVDASAPGVQGIELPATNPYRDLLFDEDSGLIYVACCGSWGALDGGIVKIDPDALEATGFVTTESQLGGNLYDFTLPLSGRAYAVISTSSPTWQQFCVSFDWTTGAKIGNVWKPGGYSVMDVEVHAGSAQLFLADRSYAAPGVRVFDALDGSQLTSAPIGASLPPHDILIVGDEIASVAPLEPATGLQLTARPNPFRGTCRLSFRLEEAGRFRATVYDTSGREVRILADRPLPSGEASVTWDGLDADGNAAACGVYFIRVETNRASDSVKTVLVR